MYFSEEATEELLLAEKGITAKALELREKFVLHGFKSTKAKEYTLQGFARRLDGLAYSIKSVFEAVPPDLDGIPERQSLVAAAALIQSFVINVSGCCDNLGWVWALERNVTLEDGSALPQRKIGLTSEFKEIWSSFPPEFRAYLSSRRKWLKHNKSFRDSLAHRIPLYIPPYTIDPRDEEKYIDLEKRGYAAALSGNNTEADLIDEEQDKLKRFSPFIVHSMSEESPTALFHAQMLTDFHTIDEMGKRFLDELDAN